ncbi:MAG TPA: transcription antitermination factor NusB [Chroococcales cyanobacterium]
MSTGRRIARELAVIVMPQLPKDKTKLERLDADVLVSRAVHMLCEYAKQNLADADAIVTRAQQELIDIEVEHPDNRDSVETLNPVKLTSGQLKEQLQSIAQAINMVAEALDIPDAALQSGRSVVPFECKKCGHTSEAHIERAGKSDIREFLIALVSTYLEHRNEIDDFIKSARSKWNIDRMVSIDRDILRLACTEAFYFADVPVNVCVSEAVELAHRFADERAAKFLNGILADLVPQAKYYRIHGKFAPEEQVPEPTDEHSSAGDVGGDESESLTVS